MWGADNGQLDGEKLFELLHKIFGRPRREAGLKKPIVRQWWDGDPSNLTVEMPSGAWLPAAPWMYEAYDVRLDPFMCDPFPEDLKNM